jgi:hypothetical protein
MDPFTERIIPCDAKRAAQQRERVIGFCRQAKPFNDRRPYHLVWSQ